MLVSNSRTIAQVVLVLLVFNLLAISGYSKTGKPNIIILLADDMGFSDLGSQKGSFLDVGVAALET